MRRKTIDTMREVRLWGGQILIPAAALILAISPETRAAASEKIKNVKNSIGNKFRKRP